MPKAKTHRSLSKRLKVSKSGRLRHRRTGYHHKLRKKRTQYKRQARRLETVSDTDEKTLKRLILKR
ncbi:MAG: 50S ribosomal protein L35 [Candidatus Bipolaricaulia bacterium]